MRILICQSYFRVLDPKEENRNMPYPPLGSIILATYLDKLDYQVSFYDCMISEDRNEIFHTIAATKPDLILIYDDEFNYLTKMSLLNMRYQAFRILQFCKKRGIFTMVYSSDAIDHPDLYLSQGANIVVIGEGETVVEDCLKQYSEDESWEFDRSLVQGIAYYKENVICRTTRKPLRKDLDILPDPEYSQYVNIEKYRKIWVHNHGYFSLNITTSRGCTYGCNWCAKPLWGRTYNSISPQRIVSQIRKLRDDYEVDHIWITDDIFGLQKSWLKEFSALCADQNIIVPYKCLSRADLLVSGHTLEYLQRSGCQTVWIGAESGSQKILDAMEKGTRVSQIYESVRQARRHKIQIAFFLQLGYIGETWSDIQLTRKMVRECLPSDIGVSVSYPLPGTKFYETVRSHLSSKQNWKDSDDLDMMFYGTYSRTFYRTVHRLIHNEYRYLLASQQKRIKNLPKLIFHKIMYFWYSIRTRQLMEKETQRPILKERINLPTMS